MNRSENRVTGESRPTADYFKTLGWVLALLYIFLALFALVAGRITGFGIALGICIAMGIAITVIFVAILALNLAVLGVVKAAAHFKRKRKLPTGSRLVVG
jgi:ABC-type nickel/cobalt efflux system permease component RcnA